MFSEVFWKQIGHNMFLMKNDQTDQAILKRHPFFKTNYQPVREDQRVEIYMPMMTENQYIV